MKKTVLLLLIALVSLQAEVINQLLDEKLYYSHTPIVDIRTPGEWRHDGILKRAIPIVSWDEKGKFNQNFIKELRQKVDVTKPFAIICRSGSRTHIVAAFLAEKLGYTVINLEGGMIYAKGKNFPLIYLK